MGGGEIIPSHTNKGLRMKTRFKEMVRRADASDGFYNLERFIDSVRKAEVRDNIFIVDTKDFLFIAGFDGEDIVLKNLVGEGEDNHPLLRELAIWEEDLKALNDGENPELRCPERLAWLASEGMKKLEKKI